MPASRVTADNAVRVEFGLVVFILAYCFFFRLTLKGTPGYRIVGIRYAFMLGEHPTPLQRLYRAGIAVFMIWGLFLVDHIWILFDERKQTWHDKISGFYVVKRSARPSGTQEVIQRIVNLMMLSLVVWEPAENPPRPATTVRPING